MPHLDLRPVVEICLALFALIETSFACTARIAILRREHVHFGKQMSR